jgi:hypothetical protein
MAAALDHQAQVVPAGEIDGRGDVLGVPRRDRVDAWLGSPRVDPSKALRKARRIADVVRIPDVFQQLLGWPLSGSVFKIDRGKSTGIKLPPTASLSCFHADLDGHAASVGRTRRTLVLAHNRHGNIGRSAADPTAFRNALLFIACLSFACDPILLNIDFAFP